LQNYELLRQDCYCTLYFLFQYGDPDMSQPVYVVDGTRTPFLKAVEPGPFSAADLGFYAAQGLLARLSIDPKQISQVVVGCVAPSAQEANIARIIALRAGCGVKVPAFTVQRNCASGLQAIDSARQNIAQGYCDLVLAGGTEAMSRAFLLFPPTMAQWLSSFSKSKSIFAKMRTLMKLRPSFFRPIISLEQGLTDPIINMNMGQTAQELAYRFNISRQEMDIFAAQSHVRAYSASPHLKNEIIPIYSKEGILFDKDTGIRTDSSVEKLSKLKPVFDKFGSITAGNSSQISDGAAFVLLASEKAVLEHNLPVLGTIKEVAWAGVDPVMMGLGPVHAITHILQAQKLSLDDIDTIEINEAFAAQVLACIKAWQDPDYCAKELNIHHDLEKWFLKPDILNPDGGAIAIGHPVGASGARLVLHALKNLERTQAKRAIASLCIGGGQGGAALLERIEKKERIEAEPLEEGERQEEGHHRENI